MCFGLFSNTLLTSLYSVVIVTIMGFLGIITVVELVQKPVVLVSENPSYG